MNLLARLLVLAAVALLVVGCPSSPSSGDLHVHISKAFDNRADEEDLWVAGMVAADGVFPAAKLDTMDIGAEYDWTLLGSTPWMGTTDQQAGDWEGDCNGGDCTKCTGTYGGSWEIDSVQLTVHERGAGRYVFDIWLGSDSPPKTGGCDAVFGGPVAWYERLLITLTGMDTANPTATATAIEAPDLPYTVTVTKS